MDTGVRCVCTFKKNCGSFDSFHGTCFFLYPLTTSENQNFLMFSGGCRKRPVPWGTLKSCHCNEKLFLYENLYPVCIYLLKVNNRNTRTRCEICSKLTIRTPERRQLRHSGVFIVNFEHISHLVLVFQLLTFNMQMPTGVFKSLFHTPF